MCGCPPSPPHCPSHFCSSCSQCVKRPHTALLFRSEEHTSDLQSRLHLVCRLLLEKKNNMRCTLILHTSIQNFYSTRITPAAFTARLWTLSSAPRHLTRPTQRDALIFLFKVAVRP